MFYRIRRFFENNKYFISFIGVLGALLILFSVGFLIMTNRMAALSIRYDASLQVFNDVNKKLLGENMSAFEKILSGSFSEKQLVRIAQKNTNYGIAINGIPLEKNVNVVYSERPTVAVLLSENYGKDTLNLLPRSIVEKGSILAIDKAPSLIKVTYGEAKLENNIYDYYYGKTLSYLVTDLKPGDIVTIEIAPEIAGKLNLEDNIIEIFYNKEFVEAS